MQCVTSLCSKTSVFARPHVNEKPAFSKLSTLESVFNRCVFGACFTKKGWTVGNTRGKNLRFQTKTDLCVRGDNLWINILMNFIQAFQNNICLRNELDLGFKKLTWHPWYTKNKESFYLEIKWHREAKLFSTIDTLTMFCIRNLVRLKWG